MQKSWLDQDSMNFLRPVYAKHRSQFNIGRAAGTGDEDEVAAVRDDVQGVSPAIRSHQRTGSN